MVNILARILDSEQNFNGSADPIITADRGYIQFLGPDFGFWLLGSLDRGFPGCPKNLTFSLLCARCHAVGKMTSNSDALKHDGSAMAVMKVALYPRGASHLSDDTGVQEAVEMVLSQNANSNNQLVFALSLTRLCMFVTLDQT